MPDKTAKTKEETKKPLKKRITTSKAKQVHQEEMEDFTTRIIDGVGGKKTAAVARQQLDESAMDIPPVKEDEAKKPIPVKKVVTAKDKTSTGEDKAKIMEEDVEDTETEEEEVEQVVEEEQEEIDDEDGENEAEEDLTSSLGKKTMKKIKIEKAEEGVEEEPEEEDAQTP